MDQCSRKEVQQTNEASRFSRLLTIIFILFISFFAVVTVNSLTEETQVAQVGFKTTSSLAGNPILDPSFGDNGIVTTTVQTIDRGSAMIRQADGKILVAGNTRQTYNYPDDHLLLRYLPDGTLDTNFGNNGVVTTSVGASYETSGGVVVQPDNKIVTVGYSAEQNELTVIRYNEDGSLDNSFGQGSVAGVATHKVGTYSYGNSLTLQSDNKIVAVGEALVNGIRTMLVVRFLENGVLDPSFGTQGIVTATIAAKNSATDIAIQDDNKIVVTGYTGDSNGKAVLLRYTPDGKLDSTFGNAGIIVAGFGSKSSFNAVAIQDNGKIIAAGSINQNYAIIARYNVDGTLDTTFSDDGYVTSTVPKTWALDVALFDDGAIGITGNIGDGEYSSEQFIFVVTGNGSPNSLYGGQGFMHLPGSYWNHYNTATAMSLFEDGDILVIGTSAGFNSEDVLLVRYQALSEKVYLPLIIK